MDLLIYWSGSGVSTEAMLDQTVSGLKILDPTQYCGGKGVPIVRQQDCRIPKLGLETRKFCRQFLKNTNSFLGDVDEGANNFSLFCIILQIVLSSSVDDFLGQF